MTVRTENALKFAAFLVLAGAVGYLLFFTPVGALCLSPEGRRELIEKIDFYVRAAGVFGPAAFVLFYGLGVLALPATPFTAAGALIFGKYLGAVCSLIGAIAGASISFFLGRYFLRGVAQGFLVGKLAVLDRKAEQHGFSVVFYLRILWFPFIVLNYAAGATRIRFSDYFWGTFLGIAPAVAIVSFFVGNLKEIVASFRGPADLLQFNVLFPAALLVFSFFLPGIARRVWKGRPPGTAPLDGA